MADTRDNIIHGLRTAGWSRIEAENEADRRIYLAELRRELNNCPATPSGYREASRLRQRIADLEVA